MTSDFKAFPATLGYTHEDFIKQTDYQESIEQNLEDATNVKVHGWSPESADVEISLDGEIIATTVPLKSLRLYFPKSANVDIQHLRHLGELEVVDEGIRLNWAIANALGLLAAAATAVFLNVYKP